MLCQCGCGEPAPISRRGKQRRFIKNHYPRVQPKRYGADNPNWKGGVARRTGGRIGIYSPGHPNAELVGKGKTPYVFRYRLEAEKHLGRYLEPGEVVHHVDDQPTNDVAENLEVKPSQAEHAREHYYRRRRNPVTGRLE
jgi:hypothetical protein